MHVYNMCLCMLCNSRLRSRKRIWRTYIDMYVYTLDVFIYVCVYWRHINGTHEWIAFKEEDLEACVEELHVGEDASQVVDLSRSTLFAASSSEVHMNESRQHENESYYICEWVMMHLQWGQTFRVPLCLRCVALRCTWMSLVNIWLVILRMWTSHEGS